MILSQIRLINDRILRRNSDKCSREGVQRREIPSFARRDGGKGRCGNAIISPSCTRVSESRAEKRRSISVIYSPFYVPVSPIINCYARCPYSPRKRAHGAARSERRAARPTRRHGERFLRFFLFSREGGGRLSSLPQRRESKRKSSLLPPPPPV